MNQEDWVDLLRGAHREPIDPAHYAAVRARVLAELGRKRKPVWRRPWLWGLAAAAVAAVFMVIPRPAPVGRTSWSAFRVYGPPAPVVAENRPVPARRRHRSLVQPKQEANQEGRPGGPPHLEPVVIKLSTDDPNVVIYWIGE